MNQFKKYSLIRKYLLSNAEEILKSATAHHKKFLGESSYRLKVIEKFRVNHFKVIKNLANHLEIKDLKKGSKIFQKLGIRLALDSLDDGLYIQEAVDGIIFLKQVIAERLDKNKELDLSFESFYKINQTIGIFCDVLASKIAFSYHEKYAQQLKTELEKRETAEKDTLKQKKYAEDVVDTVHEPLIVLDENLRVNSANPYFYTTFKVSPKETESKFIFKLGNGQWNIPKFRVLLENILSKNMQIKNYEVEHDFEKIGPKIMLINARRIDSVKLILVAIEDITTTKYHERALKSSEARYRVLVEGVKDYAIFMIDVDGKITSWNKGAEKITGFKTEEVLGKDYFLFRTEKDRIKKAQDELETVKKLGQFHEIGLRKRKDGSVFWADILTTKVYENSHLKGFAKIIRDITKQKTIEDNLKFVSEASKILSTSLDIQTTFNNIARLAVPKIADWCAIDILDEKGQPIQIAVAHVDPAKVKWAKELRKQKPPDLNSKTGLANVLRTGESELYPQITDELLKKVSKTEKEYRLVKNLGFTSAMIVPLFKGKKAIGAITFVTSETKRNYTKKDLYMAEELATRASVALENATLYKSSQEAVAVRDNFISVASHELKTPITSVKMFTQVLKKHSEQIGDTKAFDYLSKMDNQLNKLTELIYDLLNVSKIQAGRIKFKEEWFDFDKSVKGIIDILQDTEAKHELVIHGKTGSKIKGDEERISQVINNLVSNAIKYSPRADKVIIRLKADKENVTLSVQDFGIGIEKSHLEKIFERFYRVYDASDKTFPGLGIGLYIASEIIKRHGGKLWVESNVGKGSTFYFYLPINGLKISTDS